MLDRLRAAHPGVAFESCSGGGGRIDLGILARTDQVWTSDNTDPLDRLAIQEGFSQIHPARVMAAWVTDSPNTQLNGRVSSLRFRFVSAMAGVLGVGGDLTAVDARRSWPRRGVGGALQGDPARRAARRPLPAAAPGRRTERGAVRAAATRPSSSPGSRRSATASRFRRCGCADSTRQRRTNAVKRAKCIEVPCCCTRPANRTEGRPRCGSFPTASHLTLLSLIGLFVPTRLE